VELNRIAALAQPLLSAQFPRPIPLAELDRTQAELQNAFDTLLQRQAQERAEHRARTAQTYESVHLMAVLGIIAAGILVTIGLAISVAHRLARDRALLEAESLKQQVELQKVRAEAAHFQEIFLGILGHDLRTPLTSVRMGASLLQRQGLPESQLEVARRIGRAVDRMSRMVEQLVEFARGRFAGGIPVNPQPLDLAALAGQLVQEVQQGEPDRRIVLSTQGNATGNWDLDRLGEVLSNLIGNALQHGSPDRDVRVEVEGREGAVTLRVTNYGEPIAEELKSVLFEPFARGTGSGRRGLGLGLYISRLVVAAHGGAIDLQSTREEGTRFTITLPKEASTSPEAPAHGPVALGLH
jgi:signal transduction histidine kinase